MEEKKKYLIFLFSLISLLFIFTLTMTSYFFIGTKTDFFILGFFAQNHFIFMFLSNILALVFGFISIHFISKKSQFNKKQKIYLFNQFLSLLDSEEKLILEYLIKNNGSSTQYELVKISSTHKVKVHRIIEKFEKKGVIEKQKIGKINKIFLNKAFYN